MQSDLRNRTFEFARRVVRLVSSMPKTDMARNLGNQLLRSGTSIGANYRDASRARSKLEFISKLGDSLKEADESLYWLELLRAERIVPAEQTEPLLNECNELIAMLVSSINTAKQGSVKNGAGRREV